MPLIRRGTPRFGRALVASLVAVVIAATAPGLAASAPKIITGHITSFDGAPIVYTLFLPAGASRSHRVPIVFKTHGWGGTKDTKPTGRVGLFLQNGYAVLSWDARGFGESGGVVNVDSQQFEVRDVQKLIDFAASRPEIQLDGPRDPRMGMSGGSYAGGIQLMTASADRRIDAIVPEIAWNNLPQSIKPGGVLKLGWGTLLYGDGVATATADGLQSSAGPQTGSLDEHIHMAFAEGASINDWTPDILQWFRARSTGLYINGATVDGRRLPGIHAPTLLIQGASDTLFPMNQAVANFEQIRRNGTVAKMIFFCGGHSLAVLGSSCKADPVKGAKQSDVLDGAVLSWFARYLKGRAVDTGPMIRYQLQDGTFHSMGALSRTMVEARGLGTVRNTVVPTSGAVLAATDAPDSMRVSFTFVQGFTVVGIPRAVLRVKGLGTEAYLFLKLLDQAPDGKVTVIDDGTMAQKIVGLSSSWKTIHVDLAGVSWRVMPGHRLLFEVSPTSNDHSSSRLPWTVDISAKVFVPVVTPGAR